jgi:hypothetical protein
VGNILSYIKWRGDLTFSERKFCEVDNLVFSELAYVDFAGVVPEVGTEESVSIEYAAMLYSGIDDDNNILKLMAKSNRYKSLRLSNYIDVLDDETHTEFGALCIEIGDGTVYIAFRGTSDYIMGWREDFSMSFQIMGAQKKAVYYIDEVIDNPDMKYRVGGHSKGGNLAVYASMLCPHEKQGQIIEIYSNDGPGLCPDIIDTERYREIESRLIRISPEFSVIGALFNDKPPDIIVESSGKGVSQHDAMTWQVEGDSFCTKETLSKGCEFYNEIFDKWIESATLEQRQAFTKDFFDALESGGAKTLSELSKSGIDEFEVILLSIVQSESRTKIVIGKFVKSHINALKNVNFKEFLRERSTIQGILMQLAGFLFVAMPRFASKSVGVIIGLTVIAWLGKRQLGFIENENENVVHRKEKFILQMALMCIVTFLIAQGVILTHFSNIILGIFFLYIACGRTKKALQSDLSLSKKIFNMILSVISMLYGIVPIVTAGLVMEYYVMAAGSMLFIYGFGKLIYSMYENGLQRT